MYKRQGKQLFLQNDLKLQPQSFICGQSIGFSDVLSTGRIEMITVVFQPYAAKALLHIPVHLFHGKDVAMDEVEDVEPVSYTHLNRHPLDTDSGPFRGAKINKY